MSLANIRWSSSARLAAMSERRSRTRWGACVAGMRNSRTWLNGCGVRSAGRRSVRCGRCSRQSRGDIRRCRDRDDPQPRTLGPLPYLPQVCAKHVVNRHGRRGRSASTAGLRSDADDAQIAYGQDDLHRSAIFSNLLDRYKELPEWRGNLTTHMDVRDNSPYLRPAVLTVILLLYGSLIVFLLRTKPARPASVLLSTIFFVNPEPVLRFHRLRLL
jgi:hypothetical protein